MTVSIDDRIIALKKFLDFNPTKQKLKLSAPERVIFVPFRTRTSERPKFKDGFSGVTGEIIRSLLNIEDPINIDDLMDHINKKVDVKGDVTLLQNIIRLLISEGIEGLLHPRLMAFYPRTSGPEGEIGEHLIANYIIDTLFRDFPEFSDFIANKEYDSSNAITKLLDSAIKNETKTIERRDNNKYLIPEIVESFQNDIRKLMKDEKYFMKWFEILINYYYFYYLASIVYGLTSRKSTKLEASQMYYFLDWEIGGKNREAFKKGFRLLKDKARTLYFHINAIEHFNILFDEYSLDNIQLRKIFNESQKNESIGKLIKQWIIEFAQVKNLKTTIKEISNDFDEIYEEYIRLLDEDSRNNPGVSSRFSKSLDDTAQFNFLKLRGSLGYCLNISHDFLLLLVYLSAEKNTNIIELFEKFEKRGVFLDKFSKEITVDYLVKLNLIDKKSDSGVAQYVRTIL
jgi:DNA phosphorothioation-dependent restriction protein DptG